MDECRRRDVLVGRGVATAGLFGGCVAADDRPNTTGGTPRSSATPDVERRVVVENAGGPTVIVAVIVRNEYHGQLFEFETAVSSGETRTSRAFEGRPREVEVRRPDTGEWREFEYEAPCAADVHVTVTDDGDVDVSFPCA